MNITTKLPKNDSNAFIENRSIDYIPESERHGRLFSQFTLWFGANLQITAIVTGALAVVLGGDIFWSFFGLLIGQISGGVVMALHAAQGPQLGLPQMISSRVQFGVFGAVIPLGLVCAMYVGFAATGTVLAGQAMSQLFDISNTSGILIFSAFIIVLTQFGYRLTHVLGRIASVIGFIAFFYLFGALLMHNNLIELFVTNRQFSFTTFLLTISLSAAWQIAFGPYVADYSRYLPSSTSRLKIFLSVGSGSILGAQISMTLGIIAATLAGKQFSDHEVNYIVGLGGAGIIASLLYFSIIVGKLMATTLDSYGSFMSMATIISGFRGKSSLSKKGRFAYIIFIVTMATSLAIAGQHSFLALFHSFILFLLTGLLPWSAINLVDYYLVTKGRYDLNALSDPNGRYGRWNKIGIATYVIGVLIQMPFLATGFYTGFMVAHLGHTDISWVIGLIVPALIYYFTMKKWSYDIPEKLILPGRDED